MNNKLIFSVIVSLGLVLGGCSGGESGGGDSTSPAVTAPSNIIVEAESAAGTTAGAVAIVAFLAGSSAVDAADAAPVLTHDAPAIFPLGATVVIFTYTDAAGNAGTASATVMVTDTVAPVITLLGASSLTVGLNSTFTDPGSTVSDAVDTGLITTVTGTVDTSIGGAYILSYDVADVAGNNATTVTRVVAVKSWQGAERVEITDDEAAHPHAVFDDNGNAIAVWRHKDNDIYRVFASRYNGTNWSAATLVSNATSDTWDDAYDSYLAFDAISGNILMVWQQTHQPAGALQTEDSIWLREFNGTSWGTPDVIENGEDYSEYPQLAVDASGKRIAVWGEQSNDVWGLGFVRANVYNGTVWVGEELIGEGTNSSWPDPPQLAVNASGKAVVVWAQQSSDYNVYANVYNGTVWTGFELLESSVEAAFYPHVAIDSSGNAVAVWSQTDGTQYDIWARRHNGISWGTAVKIDTGSGNAYTPKVAFDSSGKVIAVWEQHDGTSWNIFSNVYDGTSWGTPELLAASVSTASALYSINQDTLQVVVDSNDNAIVMWRQNDGLAWSAHANIFNGSAWGGPELLSADVGDVDDAHLSVDANGNAIAIWDQDDGARRNVWANIFK